MSLSSTHQRKAELLADTAARMVRTEARKATTGDIDEWWDRTGPRIQSTVKTGFRSAASLSTGYLSEAAALAGFPELAPIAAVLEVAQLVTALRVTGPVAFKKAMAETGDPLVARRVMADRMSGTAYRLTRAGDRDTLFATAEGNPMALVGYRRVAEAGACKFCLMLESRGAVYFSRESASVVGGRRRPTGRAFHDHCRCRIEEIWGDPLTGATAPVTRPPVSAPDPLAQALTDEAKAAARADRLRRKANVDRVRAEAAAERATRAEEARQFARADRLRRKANVDRIRAEAARERAERLGAERAAAGATGRVDPEILTRWGVTEQQYLNARAVTSQIKGDIRSVARAEADDLKGWLFDNELDTFTRPARLQQGRDLAGRRVDRRTQSGYDWLEQLDDAELRQVRARMVDSNLHPPDVVAERIRSKMNSDMGDDEAMMWLVERWLHEDGLRAIASGRAPRYVDVDNLIPSDYAMDGYQLGRLFGVADEDAIGHVAQVQAQQAQQYAARTLGRPTNGPAPWEMDTVDYVTELEEVEDILTRTQLGAGVDPGAEYAWARARVRELVPADLDTQGIVSAEDLHETIRVTAQTAGFLGV